MDRTKLEPGFPPIQTSTEFCSRAKTEAESGSLLPGFDSNIRTPLTLTHAFKP
jgi:hypothetical protein